MDQLTWGDWVFLGGLAVMAVAGLALLAHSIWTTYREDRDAD